MLIEAGVVFVSCKVPQDPHLHIILAEILNIGFQTKQICDPFGKVGIYFIAEDHHGVFVDVFLLASSTKVKVRADETFVSLTLYEGTMANVTTDSLMHGLR